MGDTMGHDHDELRAFRARFRAIQAADKRAADRERAERARVARARREHDGLAVFTSLMRETFGA